MKKPQKTYEQIREELDRERARQAEISAKMANCEHDLGVGYHALSLQEMW